MLAGVDWIALFSQLNGRIGRRSFWIGFGAAFAVFWLLDMVVRGGPVPLKLIVWALCLYPIIAVVVKRLHDRGRTGWWVALAATPVAGALIAAFVARLFGSGEAGIQDAASLGFTVSGGVLLAAALFELGFRPSDPGFSRHGPPPLP